MKSVFLLTTGEYEDYAIHMAFPTKELADQTCEIANRSKGSSSFSVEEYSLLEEVPSRVPMYYINESQGEWQTEVWEHELQEYNLEDGVSIIRSKRHIAVRGTDQERVRKVFDGLLAERESR